MRVRARQCTIGEGEHIVQFYDGEEDLARAVGHYLSRGVSAGEVAIAIATEAHRRAFQAEMAAAGVDLERAEREGLLVWLDAADTLGRFVYDGRVDARGFRAVVGAMIREAVATGRRVRAYGEMVALLWDDGNVLAALELEKLWNALGRELRFSLYCAYHTQAVAGEDNADALHEVCELHTAVIDETRAHFRAGSDAPSAARRFVTGLLARRPYGARVSAEDAQLVVSELATNAVMHAGTPFSVSIRCDGSAVRISVQDRSSAPPVMREALPTAALSGRGLKLVAAVTRGWGVEHAANGKTVWAELALAY